MEPAAPRHEMAGQPSGTVDIAEAHLESLELIRLSELVVRAGIEMLSSGTSGLRVRELMRAAAFALGLDSFAAQVTFTNIVATVGIGGIYRTQVAEIRSPGVNSHRIAALQKLTRDLKDTTITPDELEARLDAVESAPPQYPTWLLTILVAVACASVTLLSGGWWHEALAVLPAGALGFVVRNRLGRWEINHLATVLVSAAVACLTYVGAANAIAVVTGEPSSRLAAGFICAAIFLIPGFPLVTGGLDVARIDLGVGIPRLGYAAAVILAITVGVWVVAVPAGISPDPVPSLVAPPALLWTAWVLASFFAVYGWASMFNTPLPMALTAGLIGVLGNVPRQLMLEGGVPVHVATFTACVVMGLACAVAGRLLGMEKIVMTVPTVLVAIPGSSALRTLLYFDQRDVVSAMENGVSTMLVLIGMVAGLACARMLTDPEWAFTRPDPPWGRDLASLSVRRLLPRRGRSEAGGGR